METPVEKQEIFDEWVRIIVKKTVHLSQDEFAVYAYQRLYDFYRNIQGAGTSNEAEVWNIRFAALIKVIETRDVESKIEQTEQDYRWTLMYVAKHKHYRLTETQLVKDEWVVSRTVWPHMSEALNYIRQTNRQRKHKVTH